MPDETSPLLGSDPRSEIEAVYVNVEHGHGTRDTGSSSPNLEADRSKPVAISYLSFVSPSFNCWRMFQAN
jgi:hypothetical protein